MSKGFGLNAAIKKCRDTARWKRAEATYNFEGLEPYYDSCKKEADEQDRLADWLEELKGFRAKEYKKALQPAAGQIDEFEEEENEEGWL